MHKLGIIVPYRNRSQQLQKFVKHMTSYLGSNLEYEIIVVEQDDKESFNRGALLNVGFKEARKLGCDYVVFHDVDLLPRYVDYSYSDVPLELVGKIVDSSYEEGFQIKTTDLTDDYFGGVTLFPVEAFEKINGYSNKYIGWGFEDNDLLYRCREAQIPLGYKNYRQYIATGPALTFDGEYSYARIPFNRGSAVKKGVSFLVNFRVEDLKLDKDLPHDECAVFCIPGLDAALCYESFGTYKFEVFDNYEDVYSIHTEKLPVGITVQAIVTLDSVKRQGRMYFNGKLVGKFEWPEGRNLKFGSREIYLGVGHPTREIKSNVSRKWFRGQISDFATFSRALTRDEVRSIFREGYLGLNRFQPEQWYTAGVLGKERLTIPNVADTLSQLPMGGDLVDCKITPMVPLEDFYRMTVPLKRPGTFIEQPHITNGTTKGYWKSWATRLNQFRYREVESLGSYMYRDGLNTLPNVVKVTKKVVPLAGTTHLMVKFK